MPTFRRFVAYVYEYTHGKKGKNCGYVKVDIRGTSYTFYFRLHDLQEQSPCTFYLFSPSTGSPTFTKLGESHIQNGTLQHRLTLDTLSVESQNPLGFAGLLCQLDGDTYYGTCWNNQCVVPMPPVDIADPPLEVVSLAEYMESSHETPEGASNLQIQEPAQSLAAPDDIPSPQGQDPAETLAAPEDISSSQTQEPVASVTEPQTIFPSQTDVSAEPLAGSEGAPLTAQEEFPPSQTTFEQLWAQLQTAFPHLESSEDGHLIECIKIAPADIPSLQEHTWNLSSNPFLLHGYKNYDYLILARIQERTCYILGVPGVYSKQEKFMADMFGFPGFQPLSLCTSLDGQFGYWFRRIY